ncbi:hypothetical protein [Aeromicrobium alkaliterrae]|uniref:DUF4352 domain-containing protein n=1 Tax=Aeromicrobium alkaliterrae TaxID=302168 RepID=A0ABP4VKL9_9ACTN
MITSRRRLSLVLCALALLVPLAACGGGDEPKPTPSVPAGFEVPDGVTITKPGTKRTAGETATVVYQVDEQAASAITVTIANVRKGAIEDFRFFSLTPDQQAASPFYVDLTVVNEGPAGLGGVALPVFARDDADMLLPPTPIVGSFAPCPAGQLPESFLPGETATLCLVYLVPAGQVLVSVDLQPDGDDSAITWTP